ncbi:MAG: MBL fold metallo-hydrolase [Chloroflexi bacterium]|nr:MBL fold metallo-hydrolase [Chloroflexota bacterium]
MLVHQDELLLIDTLFDADAQIILDQIQKLGKRIGDLKHILLTHGHRAHLGGLETLKRLSGATIYAHAWEADIIAGDRSQQGVSLRPMKGAQVLPILWIGSLLAPFAQHKPCPVDQLIDEGAQIGPLRVLHTPGHTPGHLAFYAPEQRALFTGDAFVTWPLVCPGWPNAMLNTKQTWASLRRMAELDVQAIGVGHGAPVRENGTAVLRQLATRGSV